MGNKLNGKLIITLVTAFILILPTINQAQQKQRIKVVAQNASVRLQPNVDSEVMLSPPVGSTFEVEQKIGEWYEIKFSSEIGVLITGYINSQFVDVVEEAPVPVPKKEPVRKPAKPAIKPRPQKARPATTSRIKFNIMAAGMFFMTQEISDHQYSFLYRSEDFWIFDKYESSSGIGFGGGLGIFITPNIELTGSFIYYSKPSWGELGIEVPHEFDWDSYATDIIETEPNVKKMIFSGGINIHPLTSGPLDIYIGGGGSYIKATVDLLYDARYEESPWPPILNTQHTVEITEVFFEETDVSTFGFHGRAGININFGSNVSFFGEGRYILAKAKDVEFPFNPDETLELNLGGLVVLAGIKLNF